MPWYQQPVRVSDASTFGIGGLPLSQNIPLASCVLALVAGAADDAAGAALAVALDAAVGVATGVVSVVFECPQAQPKHKARSQREEGMRATISGEHAPCTQSLHAQHEHSKPSRNASARVDSSIS